MRKRHVSQHWGIVQLRFEFAFEVKPAWVSFAEVWVLPLLVYLLLFWWRDRARIAHMNFTDLMALLGVAAFILGVRPEHVEHTREALALSKPFAEPAHPILWICAACVGILLCRVLIQIEKQLEPILDKYLVVGKAGKDVVERPQHREDWSGKNFRCFAWLWSVSLALIAAFVAVVAHLMGYRMALGQLTHAPAAPLVSVAITGLAAYVVGVMLVWVGRGTRYFRFYSKSVYDSGKFT